jgi:hypothetical protein
VPGAGIANTGYSIRIASRAPAAAAAASDTGMIDRGRNSNSSSSTARRTAETGLPNVAAIPAAAPAARSVLRSAAVVLSTCPISDPSAPPVAMIGPSAPKGPPVPIAIAADTGLRNVIRAGIRLWLSSTCSIASGIPCPRMALDPYRAISPTISPPSTGTSTTKGPSRSVEGSAGAAENRQ